MKHLIKVKLFDFYLTDIGACEAIMTQKSKELSFQEHLQTEHSKSTITQLWNVIKQNRVVTKNIVSLPFRAIFW